MSLFGKPVEPVSLDERIKFLGQKIEEMSIELKNTQAENVKLKDELKETKWKLSIVEKENDLANEKKLHELRKSMQESLIKSDLLRTEALAKLEVFEKTDNRQDANTIKEMLSKLIDNTGKNQPKSEINVIK